MKSLSKTMLMLLLCLTTAAAYSQGSNPKPKLFSNLPEEISLSEATLRSAFNAVDGQDISLQLGTNFIFSGKVISNEVKYHNLRSITIKSPAFNNSIFHLSQITNADNTISFVGRILNPDAFDGFEIKKDQAGNYHFRKLEMQKILQDCNQ